MILEWVTHTQVRKITLYRIIFVIPSNDWVCGKDIHEYTFNAQNHWKRCMNVRWKQTLVKVFMTLHECTAFPSTLQRDPRLFIAYNNYLGFVVKRWSRCLIDVWQTRTSEICPLGALNNCLQNKEESWFSLSRVIKRGSMVL